jgi:CheY-like chemotaxis protein
MPRKIALIDFDEALLEANCKMLESMGYEVQTATDGAAGLQLAVQMRPEIIVLELVLPKLHGLQLCSTIRQHPDLRNSKIVVAASPTYPVDVRKARDLGAATFLKKPYTPPDLARAITSLESVPVPQNETRRLASLQSYGILDTTPEAAFDEIAELAAIICETPGALISFVDSDRLWYKSKIGFVADEIPRELSFCAHALMEYEVMVVEDASKDKRFAGNPLVANSAEPIRFYAGSPLRDPSGDALGTVCVIGHEPRTLSEKQKRALRLLGNQLQHMLQWRRQVMKGRPAVAS